MEFLEGYFVCDPLTIAVLGSSVVGVFAVLFLVHEFQNERAKKTLFIIFSLVVLSTTAYLAAETIYKNVTSITGGPVHWHADFEIFSCGDGIELLDPTGFSNRVGTPVLHEHNDLRIHAEGVLKKLSDASLAKFFEVIGGSLDYGSLVVPTNSGTVSLQDGDICGDGRPGTLQVFLWETIDGIATQRKLADYPPYVMKPEALVPPGDCIIFEFMPEINEKTENICNQYEAADIRGDITIQR